MQMQYGIFRSFFMAAFTVVCVAAAASHARGDIITLDVTADIDGRDDLIISGNTLQWEHFDDAPVGLHNSSYPSTILTTTLNGTSILSDYAWTPTWPNGTNTGDYSSMFTGLDPAVPSVDATVTLDVEQARDSLTLTQLPSVGNDYTTIIEFNDDATFGDTLYEGELTFTTVPEPASVLCLGVGSICLLMRRGKRA